VVDADPELVDRVLRNGERCAQTVAAVQVARTGAEAISLARDLQPDLLLLDLDLPDVDGWALVRAILGDVQRCEAVIVTRRARPEDISLATACGARAYLVKPIGAHSPLPPRSHLIVNSTDILSDLLAPVPPLSPEDGSLAQGQ
jgi:CheY-like chemotaxis protein